MMYVTTLIYPLRAYQRILRDVLPRARELTAMMVKVLSELSPMANVLTTMLMVITDIIIMARVEKGTKLEKVIMDTTNMNIEINE